MLIMGVDPGTTGAIAIIDEDHPDEPILYDMPVLMTSEGRRQHTFIDEGELMKIIQSADHVFVEKAQSMPGQGVASTFGYGVGYGIVRGICVGLEVAYTLIHPATWKRMMMKDMDKGKGASILRAKQLFPKAKIGGRIKDHGKADALLIAYYGQKVVMNR